MKTIIKFIVVTVTIMAIAVIMSSCNYNLVDLNFKFDKVHIYNSQQDYNIIGYRDYEDGDQIQLYLEDGSIILINSMSCILVNGVCPVCKE